MVFLIDRIPLPGISEPVSSFSHYLVIPVFVVLFVFLLRKAWGKTPIVYHILFGIAAVFVLSMSGTFHLLEKGGFAKAIFQRLDHAGIFLLIAASFFPVHGILFKGVKRWGILVLMGTAAVAGVILKVLYFDDFSNLMDLVVYLGYGWLGLISGVMLVRKFKLKFIFWLLIEAACYSVGAVLDFAEWPTLWTGVISGHEIFHLFVGAGIICHWRFIWSFADFKPGIVNEQRAMNNEQLGEVVVVRGM
ncbi:MAG: hemolysin III family protein [Bacteroidia bacterium]|nr:hemolysin III family protein [Bacteroidia bacterium]